MPDTLIEKFSDMSWQERLKSLSDDQDDIAFSSSFSFEDQVITHLIASNNLPIRVFTLDTGRHFEETHNVIQATNKKYPNLKIETYYPDTDKVQDLVKRNGINGFYESLDKRKDCCYVRKVEPLNRALKNTKIWISGLRREHSENRGNLPIAEYDAAHKLIKFYPLIDIDLETIKTYIKTHNIPYNELHDKGFPSIGCAPCTRAVKQGEHPRSGRWWWEHDDAQECGLHMVDGKLVKEQKA
ncbi:MAG: phosphoadenylyl-sulfate reductase [Alphaproteobacteria bacterium]|nr:phosphoadenylyl-sulfate reductase [Alphaproteobacteria bacterium]